MVSVDIGNVIMRSRLFSGSALPAGNRFVAILLTMVLSVCVVLPGIRVQAQPVPVDKVVAIVDEDVVLQSEFDQRWVQVEAQIAKATGPVPPTAELRKQVLDQIVLEHLQLQ